MDEHNLPVPDDMPWVNLTQEEVEELRNKKHTLTEYGKQRLRELMDKKEPIVAKVSEEDYQKVFEEYCKQNKKLTLYEKLEEWVDYGNFAQSKDVLVNEIVNIVKDWLPPEHDTNDYQWNKCIKMMKENLR